MVFGIASKVAIVLAIGFSLSSTAIIVKLLTDKNQKGSIHGEIMLGWALIQDLAVIPIMSFLPALAGDSANFLGLIGKSLLSAGISIFAIFFIGRLVVPPLIHKVASFNSRELLTLVSFCVAIGTAFLVSAFGVSVALGAFLAGVVISDSQENHAVFAEMRPLRDLFLIVFFVTLGFLVMPSAVIANLGLIIAVSVFILLLKIVIVWLIMLTGGFYGKTAIAVSFGLSQVGEFAFILYLAAGHLGIMSPEMVSVGTVIALITLMTTPFLFKAVVPFWRKLKNYPQIGKFIWRGYNKEIDERQFSGHIVICGFGRVGRWVGKALEAAGIDYVAIDYNLKKVREARQMGVKAIYGDPSDPEVLKESDFNSAKAIVITVTDSVSQHETISYVQTHAPEVNIIVRGELDEDVQHLKSLKVQKVIQPEFEGAIQIVKDLFRSMGKDKAEIQDRLKKLRLSHAH